MVKIPVVVPATPIVNEGEENVRLAETVGPLVPLPIITSVAVIIAELATAVVLDA